MSDVKNDKFEMNKDTFIRSTKSSLILEIMKLNKELVRLGLSDAEIEQLWNDCIKEAKND